MCLSKRRMVLALALIALAAWSLCAHAAPAVSNADARVYASNSARSKKLATLPYGLKLEVTGVRGDWARVELNGRVGYAYVSSLTPLRDAGGAAAYASDATPVYYAANTASKKLATLAAGDGVTVRATVGAWSFVERGDVSGFVKSEALGAQPPEAAGRLAYAARDDAQVRDAAGNAIGRLALNEAVSVTAVSGDVCTVMKNGRTGYMDKADLSLTPVDASADDAVVEFAPKDMCVAVEAGKVYNSRGNVVGTLPKGTVVQASARKGSLVRITLDGRTGIMYESDLQDPAPAQADDAVTTIQPTTYYVSAAQADLYDAKGQAVLTLERNAKVTVSAYNATLMRVSVSGRNGYMYRADLSEAPVAEDGESAAPSEEALRPLGYGDSGAAVERMQRRLKELGFYNGSVGGSYMALTRSAVAGFQIAAGLTATGTADLTTLERLYADDAPAASDQDTSSPAAPARGTAIEMDWWTSDIQLIFAKGTVATITDVETGLAWREQRRGGSDHADCQPLTKADTAKMKQACGGSWSWTRRAVFVTINGINYAASMNCMPHGDGAISGNGFDGHHCIHFTNSRTAGTGKIDPLHQQAIAKALAARL